MGPPFQNVCADYDSSVQLSSRHANPRSALWLNQADMFARKIRVEYELSGQRHPCLMKWMDSFSMRNFTNASVFDDTLPVSDGLMEIGTKVPIEALHEAMQVWFRRKSFLTPESRLVLTEQK